MESKRSDLCTVSLRCYLINFKLSQTWTRSGTLVSQSSDAFVVYTYIYIYICNGGKGHILYTLKILMLALLLITLTEGKSVA